MFYMRDVGWGWEFLMVVGMVAFWALVVVAVVLLVRAGMSERTPPTPTATPTEAPIGMAAAETAIDILDRRLACGEISVEEYRERRQAMEHSDADISAPV